MAFKVTLQPSGRSFEGYDDETLLDAALEAGIHLAYGCRNGACGACKGKVMAGRVVHGNAQEHALSPAERAAGFALMCCAKPLSDLALECREAADDDIPVRIMPARVHKLERAAPDVMVMKLKLPANERLQFIAGQYVEILLKDGKRRAFSIASAPQDDEFLELHIRLVPGGEFTAHVFGAMRERDILRIEGPRGSFRLRELSQKPIILLAGGTGFAPIKSIVEYALHNRIARPMTLYWGARDRSGLYLPELPRQWAARHAHIRYVPVLSEPQPEDGWDGRTGLAHAAVLADHADLSNLQVYACGAPAMIDAARRDFRARGLPDDEFIADAFTFAPKAPPPGKCPAGNPPGGCPGGNGLGPRPAMNAPMDTLVRREPVVNRQKALTASRLVVHAPSARAAVETLNGLAEVWPATHNVLVALAGAAPDEALLDWCPPANALLEFPAPLFATAAGQALADRLAAAGTALCLGNYDLDIALPATPRFQFTLADARLYPHMPHAPALPLAQGLADHEAFADAIDSGYAGAAGWFFLHGLPAGASKLNPGHAQIIHILNLVRQNAEIADIEAALKQDISISFKLLRYINSAGFGLATKIQSFRHAVTMIGYDKLNKWLSLLLVTASRDAAAPVLMQTAIVRGRFMELTAAGGVDKRQLDNLFIAGSFSLLDALLGSKIEAVLKEMSLPETITEALLHRAGPCAPYLELALACEQEDTADLAARAAALGLSATTINRAQVEALAFADSLQLD